MKKLLTWAILLAALLIAVPVSADPGTLYVDDDDPTCGGNSPCYPTIQAAINAASAGDTINVAAGTYPEQLVIDRAGITLQGDESYPMVQPALGDCNKYDTVISVKADNITLRGLDISNARGVVDLQTCGHIEHHGIWDGSWTVGQPGLTVDDCKFHDIEHGVRSYGDEFTVTNSEFYRLGRTGVYASGYGASSPLLMTVKNNWFHDYIPVWKENHGVHVKYDGRVGKVSYNYMSGMRMGIAYYNGGPKPGFGQMVFRHNTFDLDYDLDGGTKPMTMGISLYGTGANADNILIQDNIFANAWWYAIYQEGATIAGSITVDNNLFYNNYWHYWPDFQYPHQWFGDDTRAQAGWTGGEPGFTFTNNLSAQDPLFKLEGAGPEAQWALQCGSPALQSASDGSNIGAWQGQPVCVIEVTIDIKPGSYPNSINLGSMGVVPVALLTTDDFDATAVDPVTVLFAGASPLRWTTEDVDGDGDLDLLFHFETQQLDLVESSTEATLTGTTFGGQAIQGTDTVNIVP